MTDLTSFFKTDLVDDHLANDVNVLLAAALRAEYANTESISATKELSDNDTQFQFITASSTDRTVELAPEATSNHVTVIYNAGASNNLLIKEDSGTTTYAVLRPGQWAMFLPFSGIAWILLKSSVTNKGYLQENSAQLLYVGAQAYSVLPGSADVNGSLLNWASNIARTGLSLTANTLYYVYLYSNAGAAAVEESTTVPVWDGDLNCYKKTGDATRRCIGWIEASGTNTMRPFMTVANGRNLELVYIEGTETGRVPVSAATSATNWTSFSLAPIVPSHATHVSLLTKMIGTTLADDGITGLSAVDLGSSVAANLSQSYVRGKASAANANVFFGATWLNISVSQTYYYKTQAVVGTPTTTIVVMGARIVR